jgi:hypothetical protein
MTMTVGGNPDRPAPHQLVMGGTVCTNVRTDPYRRQLQLA